MTKIDIHFSENFSNLLKKREVEKSAKNDR